jgi:hypothetical protein
MASRGFTLPLALVAIGAAALGLSALMNARHNAVQESRRTSAATAFELAASSANARALYVALSEPMGARGVRVGAARFSVEPEAPLRDGLRRAQGGEENWRLDGRMYRIRSNNLPLLIAGQDVAGLLNAQIAGSAALTRWFTLNGVADLTARGLGDTVSRALNPSQVNRRNAQGVDPIAGFVAPQALLPENLRATQMARAAERELSTRTRAPWINPNTAPRNVLVAAFGLTERQGETVMRERETRVLDSAEDVASISGAPGDLPLLDVRGAVARTIRVRIACECTGETGLYVYDSWLSLPQEGDSRPFAMRTMLHRGTGFAAIGDERAAVNATEAFPEPRASRAGRDR